MIQGDERQHPKVVLPSRNFLPKPFRGVCPRAPVGTLGFNNSAAHPKRLFFPTSRKTSFVLFVLFSRCLDLYCEIAE